MARQMATNLRIMPFLFRSLLLITFSNRYSTPIALSIPSTLLLRMSEGRFTISEDSELTYAYEYKGLSGRAGLGTGARRRWVKWDLISSSYVGPIAILHKTAGLHC
jgi:hypothetical protein